MNHNHNQAHQSSKRVLASTSSPNRTSGTFRIDILRFLLDSSRRSNRGGVYTPHISCHAQCRIRFRCQSPSVPRIESAALEHVESSINAARKLLSSSKQRKLYRVGATADTRDPLPLPTNVAL